MSSEFAYRPLDNSSRDQIRVLSLAPSNSFPAPIHVSLSIVNLTSSSSPPSSPPVYEALSYCWGNALDTVIISCNGQPFSVTRNLESALRHLRQKEGHRVIWADAICIDQANLVERACQVNLMREIYQTASRALVWLGEDAADSQLVFPLCKRLMRTWHDLVFREDAVHISDPTQMYRPDLKEIWTNKLIETRRRKAASTDNLGDEDGNEIKFFDSLNLELPSPWLNNEFRHEDENNKREGEEPGDIYYPSEAEVIAIFKLLGRPYFTRCWVLQEVALAKEAYVICDLRSLRWEGFFKGFFLIMVLGDGGLRGRPETFLNSNFIMIGQLREKEQYRVKAAQSSTLLWLFWQSQILYATDPRDKVYSLLGLIDTKERAQMDGLTPDYTISVEQCYRRAVMAVMTYTKRLDVLLVTERNPGSLLRDLSSWVPDLTHYRASPLTGWDLTGRINGDILTLSGYAFDSIVELGDILTLPRNDIFTTTPAVGALTSYWNEVVGGLGRYLDTLVKWEKIAFSRKYPKYPTGDDQKTAYAMTLCAGNIAGPQEALLGFEKWRKVLRGPRAVSFLGPLNYKPLVAVLGVFSNISNGGDRVFATATERTLYRRLARTKKGYLALVPGQSAIGDQISLFKGCQMPLVTQATPRKNTHKLIGPTFVHGIMYGEVWDTTLVRDIAIV
ncbi:heterokaryon incompatibility protein-domain-containing protein [Xylariaceae sp. FL0255]|nr:heterokaryon incompatibility protein-domain-containing protein [Xylariaceae sp. FL0255]